MAVAFTTQDPDGDGRADTYGLDIPGMTEIMRAVPTDLEDAARIDGAGELRSSGR
jgi:hypothetical protein